jgi:hypothetical protein
VVVVTEGIVVVVTGGTNVVVVVVGGADVVVVVGIVVDVTGGTYDESINLKRSNLLVTIPLYSSNDVWLDPCRSRIILLTGCLPNLFLYTAMAPVTWGAAIDVPEAVL